MSSIRPENIALGVQFTEQPELVELEHMETLTEIKQRVLQEKQLATKLRLATPSFALAKAAEVEGKRRCIDYCF